MIPYDENQRFAWESTNDWIKRITAKKKKEQVDLKPEGSQSTIYTPWGNDDNNEDIIYPADESPQGKIGRMNIYDPNDDASKREIGTPDYSNAPNPTVVDEEAPSFKGKSSFDWKGVGKIGSKAISIIPNIYNNGYDDSSQDGIIRLFSKDAYNNKMAEYASNYTDYSNTKNNVNHANEWIRHKDNELINNPNAAQMAGDVGLQIAKGAATGAQYGGGYGAIVGGAVGAVVGGANLLKNKVERDSLNATALMFNKDDINRKVRQAQINDNNQLMLADMGTIVNNKYAEGGFLPDYGGNGVEQFNVGGQHEQNPYGGIPQGMAPDGEMNYVQEGEVKYKDYIYSNILKANKELLEKYKLPKRYAKKDIADIAKELQKDSEERPNDAISKRTLDVNMKRLQALQEEVKQRREEARINALLDKMSPQEKSALLQQALMSQQGQQVEYYEQQPQGNPYDMYAQQGYGEEMYGEQEMPYAEGGKIHIADNKKGTFTAAATKHGMGVQEFANHVLANPDDYSTLMVRKANFAKNASKWHDDGGWIDSNAISVYPDGGSLKDNKDIELMNDALYRNALMNEIDTYNDNIDLIKALEYDRPFLMYDRPYVYANGGHLYTPGGTIKVKDRQGNVTEVELEDLPKGETYKVGQRYKGKDGKTYTYKKAGRKVTDWKGNDLQQFTTEQELNDFYKKNFHEFAKHVAGDEYYAEDEKGNKRIKNGWKDLKKYYANNPGEKQMGQLMFNSNGLNEFLNYLDNIQGDDAAKAQELAGIIRSSYVDKPGATYKTKNNVKITTGVGLADDFEKWAEENRKANKYDEKWNSAIGERHRLGVIEGSNDVWEEYIAPEEKTPPYVPQTDWKRGEEVPYSAPVRFDPIPYLYGANYLTAKPDYTYATQLRGIANDAYAPKGPQFLSWIRPDPKDEHIQQNIATGELASVLRGVGNSSNRANQTAQAVALINANNAQRAAISLATQDANRQDYLKTHEYNDKNTQFNLSLAAEYDKMNDAMWADRNRYMAMAAQAQENERVNNINRKINTLDAMIQDEREKQKEHLYRDMIEANAQLYHLPKGYKSPSYTSNLFGVKPATGQLDYGPSMPQSKDQWDAWLKQMKELHPDWFKPKEQTTETTETTEG